MIKMYLNQILRNFFSALYDNLYTIYKALGVTALFIFQEIRLYIFVVLFLLIADAITGIWAAIVKGEQLTSKKLRKGLIDKTVLYAILMLSVFGLDMLVKSVVSHETYYFSFVIVLFIAIYEISSIAENMAVIRPDFPFLQPVVRLIKKLGKKTEDKLEERIDTVVDAVTEFKIENKTTITTETVVAPVTPPTDGAA